MLQIATFQFHYGVRKGKRFCTGLGFRASDSEHSSGLRFKESQCSKWLNFCFTVEDLEQALHGSANSVVSLFALID